MRIVRVFPSLVGLIVVLSLLPDRAARAKPQASPTEATEQCTALAKVDFAQIPDAVTQVTKTNLEKLADGAPAFCEVSGYVAPSIRFRLRLPSGSWNGRFIELGCGGSCGTTEHISECAGPLRRGYACIVSDGGNSSSGEDLKWAYNNPESVIEYIIRASHVTALVGKAIASRFYGKPPTKSYFMGCSAGGLQAMTEAQRFPWDFDGIVAGDPPLSLSEGLMNLVWSSRALTSSNGKAILTQTDLETLHKAVVAKCDLNDGVKDGVIGDPRLCKFAPEELACETHRREGCFSSLQLDAIRKIYRGPVTKTGISITTPHVFMGSELTWLDWFGSQLVPEWFRYYLFQPNPGPSWTIKDLDFDRDYRRFGIAELTEPVNPDLRRLKSANGKLLLYMGWNDPGAGVGRAIDYYESAERLMGGRSKTQDFFRLFVIPGMNHCTTGEGPFAIDYLSYIEAWVEKGEPPNQLIGFHVNLDDLPEKATKGDQEAWDTLERRLQFPLDPATVTFARPIYPYPTRTTYLGHGEQSQATNFGPVQP
jgi:feruloyl esterase